MKPSWYEIAQGELGVKELAGGAAEARIVKYHATTTLKATSDEISWCSSFVNWCITRAGLKGTNFANARSWLTWGKRLDEPQEGCIVVFRRGTNPKSGHVAFFVGQDGNYIRVLGGNQGDMVKVLCFPVADVLGYRWPMNRSEDL